jgi:hypothetical protein
MIELNITSHVVLYAFFVGSGFLVWALYNYGKSLKDINEAQRILDQQMKTNEEARIRLENVKEIHEATQKKYEKAKRILEEAKKLHQVGPYL